MSQQMSLSNLPFELQKQILDHLDQADHMAMYQTSTAWQAMIKYYLSDVNKIRSADWRWYCRHHPQVAYCTECLNRMKSRNDVRGLARDWNWWI